MRVTLIALFIALFASLVWQYSPKRTEPQRVREQAESEVASEKQNETQDAEARAIDQRQVLLERMKDQIVREQSRLESLRASLEKEQATTSGNENPRAEEVATRVSEIEEQIRLLNNTRRQTIGNSSAIGASVEQQLQAIDNSLFELQSRVNEGPQILEQMSILKAERDRILTDTEARGEDPDTAAKRAQLQNELADLRAEQAFWKQRAQEAAPQTAENRDKRIQELQGQISKQQGTVERLRDQYAACVASDSDVCH